MPQNTQDIINTIQGDNAALISAMLKDLIETHTIKEGTKQRELYKRYKQDNPGVPIYSKEFANYEKVHETIPNDFFGDIVDLKTGYMGNEIIIVMDERKIPEKTARDADDQFLRDFAQKEGSLDENSELLKMAAICGKSFRLLYVSAEDGEAAILNSDPWETVVYRDGALQTPVIGLRYYKVSESEYSVSLQKMEHKERYRVEWYDSEKVIYYREDESDHFTKDTSMPQSGPSKGTGEQPHMFNGVPVIEFLNNKEGLSEAKKVLDLIDAYDEIVSDATSEVEQLRMAYMWARGAGMVLDVDFENQLKQTGLWPLPSDGEIGFASKDLNGEFVKTILAEIRRNIYSFAKSIDLSSDKGGEMRVIGWQIALLRLEMSAQVTERKFKRSYQRQYGMLTEFWKTNENTVIDPLALSFTFTRKFPKDVDQEIKTLVEAIAVLPLETAYGLMTFIDDPVELAKKFKKEKPEMAPILGLMDDDSAQQ